MKTALIVMTILGCDDSVTQCHYVATVEKGFTTISECDKRSESEIATHQNKNYPVIVAVCETPDSAAIAHDAEADQASARAAAAGSQTGNAAASQPVGSETLPAPVGSAGTLATTTTAAPAGQPATLPRRALDLITGVLPSRDQLKAVVTTPVHTLENGYSWVARRFSTD